MAQLRTRDIPCKFRVSVLQPADFMIPLSVTTARGTIPPETFNPILLEPRIPFNDVPTLKPGISRFWNERRRLSEIDFKTCGTVQLRLL